MINRKKLLALSLAVTMMTGGGNYLPSSFKTVIPVQAAVQQAEENTYRIESEEDFYEAMKEAKDGVLFIFSDSSVHYGNTVSLSLSEDEYPGINNISFFVEGMEGNFATFGDMRFPGRNITFDMNDDSIDGSIEFTGEFLADTLTVYGNDNSGPDGFHDGIYLNANSRINNIYLERVRFDGAGIVLGQDAELKDSSIANTTIIGNLTLDHSYADPENVTVNGKTTSINEYGRIGEDKDNSFYISSGDEFREKMEKAEDGATFIFYENTQWGGADYYTISLEEDEYPDIKNIRFISEAQSTYVGNPMYLPGRNVTIDLRDDQKESYFQLLSGGTFQSLHILGDGFREEDGKRSFLDVVDVYGDLKVDDTFTADGINLAYASIYGDVIVKNGLITYFTIYGDLTLDNSTVSEIEQAEVTGEIILLNGGDDSNLKEFMKDREDQLDALYEEIKDMDITSKEDSINVAKRLWDLNEKQKEIFRKKHPDLYEKVTKRARSYQSLESFEDDINRIDPTWPGDLSNLLAGYLEMDKDIQAQIPQDQIEKLKAVMVQTFKSTDVTNRFNTSLLLCSYMMAPKEVRKAISDEDLQRVITAAEGFGWDDIMNQLREDEYYVDESVFTEQPEEPDVPDKPEEPVVTPDPDRPTEPEKPIDTIVEAKSIKISAQTKKIAQGKKVRLQANVLPENTSDKKVIWTSSNKKVAKVDSKGTVTAGKKAGGKSVVITATCGKVKQTYKITVVKGVVKKVSISGKASVKAGKTLKLKAKVKATKKAYKALKWTSSNTKYATVTNKGLVKATKAGKGKTVKITASALDGSGKKAVKIVRIN